MTYGLFWSENTKFWIHKTCHHPGSRVLKGLFCLWLSRRWLRWERTWDVLQSSIRQVRWTNARYVCSWNNFKSSFRKSWQKKAKNTRGALEAAKEAEEKLEEMRLKQLQLEEQLEEQHAEPWICWFAENKLFFPLTNPLFGFPSCSMYGIVTYIYPKNGPVL